MAQITDEELYGKDVEEYLARWDKGDTVWTIEMGGLGPGYEQAIQITMIEILRFMQAKQYKREALQDDAQWPAIRKEIEKFGFADEKIKKLGLSGAQWGAAVNLASHLYLDGPAKVMTDERVKDRHIQVDNNFPI